MLCQWQYSILHVRVVLGKRSAFCSIFFRLISTRSLPLLDLRDCAQSEKWERGRFGRLRQAPKQKIKIAHAHYTPLHVCGAWVKSEGKFPIMEARRSHRPEPHRRERDGFVIFYTDHKFNVRQLARCSFLASKLLFFRFQITQQVTASNCNYEFTYYFLLSHCLVKRRKTLILSRSFLSLLYFECFVVYNSGENLLLYSGLYL